MDCMDSTDWSWCQPNIAFGILVRAWFGNNDWLRSTCQQWLFSLRIFPVYAPEVVTVVVFKFFCRFSQFIDKKKGENNLKTICLFTSFLWWGFLVVSCVVVYAFRGSWGTFSCPASSKAQAWLLWGSSWIQTFLLWAFATKLKIFHTSFIQLWRYVRNMFVFYGFKYRHVHLVCKRDSKNNASTVCVCNSWGLEFNTEKQKKTFGGLVPIVPL